jgi:hypothetical protein
MVNVATDVVNVATDVATDCAQNLLLCGQRHAHLCVRFRPFSTELWQV